MNKHLMQCIENVAEDNGGPGAINAANVALFYSGTRKRLIQGPDVDDGHVSYCATHNAPALLAGDCNCTEVV